MKKVSVVIPVYNVAEYLDECIKSVVSQEYEDKEIILIDDGSTDGSSDKCDTWAQKYDFIRTVHQENAGICAARNVGLQLACGEYVVFVDSDDYLAHKNVFSAFAQKLEQENADIVVGDYARLWNGRILTTAGHKSFCYYERESGAFRFCGFFSVGVLAYAWGKMYRRSFLQKNSILFGDYTYAEDKMFNCLCYGYGARYAFLDDTTYIYRKNDTSVSYRYRADSVESWMHLAQDLQQVIESKNWDVQYKDLVANIISFAAFFDGKMVYVEKQHSLVEVQKLLKRYRDMPLAKKYFCERAAGKGLKKLPSFLWKCMIWGFSVGMCFKWYFLIALGVKLLVDGRIDERLSDTGLREVVEKGSKI